MSDRVNSLLLQIGACALAAVFLSPRASAVETRARSPRPREIEELILRLEGAEREQRKLRAVGPVQPVQDPPRETLLGSIRQVDTHGLITIDVGSRSGLERGNTLEVYSSGPQPRWLGTIRTLEVRPRESVGMMIRRPARPVKVGDRVSGPLAGK